MTQKAAELLQLNHDKFPTNNVDVLTTIVSAMTIFEDCPVAEPDVLPEH